MKLFWVHGYKFAQERGPLNFEAWSKLCWVLGTWVQISSSPKFGSIQAKSVMKLCWVHGYKLWNLDQFNPYGQWNYSGYMGTWVHIPKFGSIQPRRAMKFFWVHGYKFAQERASKFWGMIKIVLGTGYMGTNLFNNSDFCTHVPSTHSNFDDPNLYS